LTEELSESPHETGLCAQVEGVHMAKSKTKKGSSTKAAKAVVEDDEEDEDLELEELEDDDEADAKPAKSKKSSATDEVTFGAADLAKLLSEKTGKTITARDLRTQLRRMARRGELDREIVPGNKSRYDWSGPNDPEVKKIVKAVLSGEMEEAKKEQLAALKERKAKKDADKAKAAKKGKKAKQQVVEEDDDDDDEDDD
jgi:hypothetical protein